MCITESGKTEGICSAWKGELGWLKNIGSRETVHWILFCSFWIWNPVNNYLFKTNNKRNNQPWQGSRGISIKYLTLTKVLT